MNPTAAPTARVNGVALHAAGEVLRMAELRQRACTELLRQAAQRAGLLAAEDAPVNGIPSEAATEAIEALLERHLQVSEPPVDACRRHYAAQAARYRVGERARLRHILFAVTPGVDVALLRRRAEAVLLDVRSHDGRTDVFAQAARAWSNCPSGAAGGELGWLTATDCAPEFARALFGQPAVGVLPRLVSSRHGLHIVEVLEREPGIPLPFDAVQAEVAATLRQHAFATALHQYLAVLAAQARIDGVDLGLPTVPAPLVQ